MNQSQLIEKFKNQDKNKLTKTTNFSASNMYCDGKIIYSYGHHFPLAKYLTKNFFIKNGDKYSNTTSQHQAGIECILSGVTISRNAIENIIEFKSIERKHIIDYREDFINHNLFYNK
jgi:hypothetical protein